MTPQMQLDLYRQRSLVVHDKLEAVLRVRVEFKERAVAIQKELEELRLSFERRTAELEQEAAGLDERVRVVEADYQAALTAMLDTLPIVAAGDVRLKRSVALGPEQPAGSVGFLQERYRLVCDGPDDCVVGTTGAVEAL